MDSYSQLVTRVLKNDTLAKAVADMKDPDCLNLVTLDWQSRLENDINYQDLITKGESLWFPPSIREAYVFEKMKGPEFQMYVVGVCRFAKKMPNVSVHKPAIFITGLGPLIKVANQAYKDVQFQEGTDFKFNFNSCSILSCNQCELFSQTFIKAGHKLKPNQPCISDTRIFNGENIVNRFQCFIEDSFQGDFLALIRLKINSRYCYKSEDNKQFRVGGTVADIVAFQDSKLGESKAINLGDLAPVDNPEDDSVEESEENPPKKIKMEVQQSPLFT